MALARSATSQVPLLKPLWMLGRSPLVAPDGYLSKKRNAGSLGRRSSHLLHIPIRNTSSGASGATG